MPQPLLPGATIGVLGGGQLGRMLCAAARNMGYQLIVLDPDADSPAGKIADRHICAEYQDKAALDDLANACDVITTEFENIPADSLRYLATTTAVYPDANALEIAQHRVREKTFASKAGLQPVNFREIKTADDISDAADAIGLPAILKSATLGYDGKGQAAVDTVQQLTDAFHAMGGVECVLEQKVDIDREISVIVARNCDGDTACFPAAENIHINGILHTSTVPASVSHGILEQARQQATALVQNIHYIGVLAVEFFVSKDGALLFNEMAPRTHNSGHYTGDACVTSQFEQQTRMICGLPVGDTRLISPVIMVNMLGDCWPPDWNAILGQPNIKLHLYGKKAARAGRKMGHFNVLADDVRDASQLAETVFAQLTAGIDKA